MACKALLIGINRYRIPGVDLRGCVNDVQDVRRVLLEYFGFSKRNITTLVDLSATQKRIEAEIAKLVRGAKSGDVLLLHYSGHGANVPDDDGDEADNRDEILCPTDLDWKKPLRDDWLRKTFDKLPPKVNLTVIMDCCHSGTNTRALTPPDALRVPRFLPNPWDLVATESGRMLRGAVRTTRPAKRQRGYQRFLDVVDVPSIPELLISGCRDTQTSADAYIEGAYHGALTYFLVQSIDDSQGQATYRDLHARTILRLNKGKYDQVPQLEGRTAHFDLPFLAPLT